MSKSAAHLLPAPLACAGCAAPSEPGALVPPSYSPGSWAWGLDLGWQNTIATHIQHSDMTRRTFDDRNPTRVQRIGGPRDGWYRFTGERFRFGLSLSHDFGGHWLGAAALGTLFGVQDQGVYLQQVPFYLEIATRTWW